ncbi:hypothetical protein NDU88_006771 [Pleurodeles waltl]|uniref:Uncharacterized protein n=1 Tax=Pleurodeles waltl TaxID=8319 RepID=A0AAV7N072_PLEWA|nr:hypothetical protein NDU88_006771 [Pleurodeles waltl]
MGKTGRRRDTDNTIDLSAKTLSEREDPRKSAPGERKESDEPTLQDVMQAIITSRVALEGKIDSLASDLTVLRDDHCRLAEKVNCGLK